MTKRPNDAENEMPRITDYLWDRSGTPDPEIQRLESLLAEFRHVDRTLTLPAEIAAPARSARVQHFSWLPRLAAAAVLLLAVAIPFFLPSTRMPAPLAGPAWNIANIEGHPQIGAQLLSANQSAAKLYVGQTLTTNSSSRASLSENDLGEIQIDPDSRVRLLQSGPHHKRLQLDVGTIHAAIWAPPGQFVVDTPSAIAIDLGCAYTLQVAPDGSGTIRTTLGWVGFHLNGRDSFIPAGAMCSTRPKVGPSTPYFEDANAAFREALHNFDQADPSSDTAATALATVLAQARSRDGLTLWHLLSRTTGPARAQVYARFAALVPPPAGVTREGILQLDPHMLDLYWNALDLGDISTWRYWEQSSDPKSNPPSQLLPKKDLAPKKSQ
ncbi:MAG TPA: FecR domain-containing protein [Candidatus Sulfotelmatobacter sp.]|nr:FecR domain-containing protein [Candidatus Sulfotelmatobacter sp.]